jgi:hypothetical protein
LNLRSDMSGLFKKRKSSEEEDENPKRQKSGATVVVAGKWKEGLSDLLQWQEKEAKRQRDALLLRRRDAVAMDTRTENVGLVDPEARLADLRRDLYSSGMIPTKQQKQLFDLTMAVSLKWIIGDDFELHKPDLLKLMGLTDLFHDVHFIMPRQYGKTTGVALTVKTLALRVPMKICIFSTGARTARALMKMILKFIEQTPVKMLEFCRLVTLFFTGRQRAYSKP